MADDRNDESPGVIRQDIEELLDALKQKVDQFSVSQLGVKLCPINQRVGIFVNSRPRIPGTVVGYAFHELPAAPGARVRKGITCIVKLDEPFDSPHGFYCRYLVVPHGGFEPM